MDLRLNQIKIYVGKCFRVFINENGWKMFVSAIIITLLISSVTGNETFEEFTATRNGAFAFVCACIWIGIFNSIQSICRERAIIKREYRSGLHISSYIVAHLIFEFALCLIESILVTTIVVIANESRFPENGVLMYGYFEMAITFFLIIFTSDALGILVSSIVKTENTAMTAMPFVLIIQLVMSGMLFSLEGIHDIISNLTISKWGLRAVCVTANVNELRDIMPEPLRDMALRDEYTFTQEHMLQLWGILLIFIVIYAVASIISLKFVDRDKR